MPIKKAGIFVTGTDTGVGKTLVSSLLLASLDELGLQPGYFKPIQTGTDDDSLTVQNLIGLSADRILAPSYRFSLPAAPSRAADYEKSEIKTSQILSRWKTAADGVWIIEGAGGLLVPISRNEKQFLVVDLISLLEVPVLIVASTRLGTINHTLLTLEVARQRGLSLFGVILSGPKDPGLKETLEEFGKFRILAEIPEISPDDLGSQDRMRDYAKEYLSQALLTRLNEGT